MHEFSIVQNIIEIVLDTAGKNGINHVSAVEVEVGRFSGVVKESMEFAWEAAGKGSMLENTILVIKDIPLRVRCRDCKTMYDPEIIYDPCPSCGSVNPEVISGKELRVVAIEG